MGYYDFPHTRNYDTDLGYLIKQYLNLRKEVNDLINLQSIIYADPLQWDISKQYRTNTIVVNGYNAYLSKQPVPENIEITNTDYWLVVGDFIREFDDIRNNISSANEKSSTVTSPRSKGDLVWLNDTLYVCLRDLKIGDAYVIDANVEKKTVEEFVNEKLGTLKEYVDSNVVTLNAGIDNTKITLKEYVDSNVETLNARIDNIKITSIYTLKDLGCVDDGITDNTAKINEIISDIGNNTATVLVNGKDYLVTGNVSFPSNINLSFTGGSFINNGTLSINGDIESAPYNILKGNGDFNISKTNVGYVEYFNEDFNKTIDTFSTIKLLEKTYTINADVIINKSNISITGVKNATSNGSHIITKNGKFIIGDTSGIIINNYPHNITLSNITFTNEKQTEALQVSGVLYGLFEELTILTHTNGIFAYNNVNTHYNHCRVQSINSTGTNFCFELGSRAKPRCATGANASLYITDCTAQRTMTGSDTGGTVYGWYLDNGTADTYLTRCEGTALDIGIALDGTDVENNHSFVDTFLNGCVMDAIRHIGYIFINIPNGNIQAINCYNALANLPTALAHYQLNNCAANVTLNSCQCVDITTSGAKAIQAIGNAHLIAVGFIITYDNNCNIYETSGTKENVYVQYLSNGTLGIIDKNNI